MAQREQRAGSRASEAVLLLQVREFESCSHEYHHLLGSEVTGNFCRDCMRSARRNSPLSAVLLLHSRHRSVHVPTRTLPAKLHHVPVRLFFFFFTVIPHFEPRLPEMIANAAALIVTFNLNLN